VSRIFDFVVSAENLNWAWQKARRLYRMADGVYDIAEVSAFELNLENELESIQKAFRSLSYKLAPLVLLPQPKKSDAQGNPQMRQSFHVAVRDQVAWIAIANAIGPHLDSKMPAWSYGHRLYKAAWYETEGSQHRLEVGPYRHSSGQLYRRFKHSWPLFRRHVSLTARAMANGLDNQEQLDASERNALHFAERPTYLDEGFWPKTEGHQLYYASIDLERFYPSTTIEAVLRGIRENLDRYEQEHELQALLARMLSFTIGTQRSAYLRNPICQPETRPGAFRGIPTGLMVAGFLSNVAMLPLDLAISARVQERRRVAHFRFVDDHVVLAYRFEDLVDWIRAYKNDLAAFSVGPAISDKKYSPPNLAGVINADASTEAADAVKAQCEIDGLRPAKLMTKTLALVSDLAGAGFEIMPDHAREQRLSELEWLLLANLPDDEIRSDTRAAFAAGRISALVPMSFDHSIELLESHRRLSDLQAKPQVNRELIAEAQSIANQQRRSQANSDRRRLNHYFKLLLQAFHDHPDKPRLFIRALDYCRTTGQRGTPELLKWIVSELETRAKRPLATYLGPLAIQTIARHIVTAAFDMSDYHLLERQRRAARSYLISLTRKPTQLLLRQILALEEDTFAGVASRNALLAAVSYASDAIEHERSKLKMQALAAFLGAPSLTTASSQWLARTGSPISVWVHWLDSIRPDREFGPGLAWQLSRDSHDPSDLFDRNSLRKGPQQMSLQGSAFWSEYPRFLDISDAGWLLEQRRSEYPIRISEASKPSSVFRKIVSHTRALERSGGLSLEDWVSLIRELPSDDPRVGEWTALEIIRQLVASVEIFPTGRLETLDELHPSNVMVPASWREPKPPGNFTFPRWTWESWKQITRQKVSSVAIVKSPISDFRRDLTDLDLDSDPEHLWLKRLRGIGLLLLGLCSRNLALPAAWNIRGAERDVGRYVRARLEEATISSRTQGIIEAALLSRSIETALIRFNPKMFFGFRKSETVNDTATDPPLISDVQTLLNEIRTAQIVLERRQISVLHHAPRQLVPMNVFQLTRVATPLDMFPDDQE